ncbi:zinc finger protein ZAT4-like [Abrus precatorius]|uniref:Zinc finger protein ZAT4-like n=1 Tax=Abrus precatorius TaxID=3816 RepID=A0A8B8JYB6_ABRPR|nr:zinc finger protein ZAT4-like [Abrus precatorius]
MMERHKCKLCSRSFANGRALGGHMKAHLATLPLPLKPQTFTDSASATSLSYSSSSSSSESEQEEDEEQVVANRESEEKSLIYGLRENPKKSFKLADPEFSSFAPDTASVVQDRESETESKNPTGQRSKRNRKSNVACFMVSTTPPPTDPEPLSSVSDTSPEEDVAMCLMMLSRDKWKRNNNVVEQRPNGSFNKEIKFKRVRGNLRCHNCGKSFRSSRALGTHTSICFEAGPKAEGNNTTTTTNSKSKVFECPFCYKVFGSGQALGGHKRSHLIPSSSTAKYKESFIDLNLPAPVEEDDLSVLSDA